MSGYVAMSRDWQAHDIFRSDEFSRRDAWAWLISQAAWKPAKVRIKGASVVLERGELCFSVRFLAQKWRWSKSKVDRFLAVLRDEGMIETRSKIGTTAGHPAGQGQSIISVCNYDKFQSPLKGERDNAEPQIGTTAGQQRDKEEPRNHKNNARETLLPEDWQPKEFGEGTQCRKITDGWNADERAAQIEAFSAHHRGHGNKWVNWQEAWKTWVLNSRNFKPRASARPIESAGYVYVPPRLGKRTIEEITGGLASSTGR